MLKAVVDTNLFVRGLLKGETVLPLIEALKDGKFQLVTSSALIAELIDVLGRDRLRKYFAFEDIKELLDLIDSQGVIIEPNRKITACRDAKDNIVLECAVAGGADYIITADQDLLVLDPFGEIKITSPQEFIRVLI